MVAFVFFLRIDNEVHADIVTLGMHWICLKAFLILPVSLANQCVILLFALCALCSVVCRCGVCVVCAVETDIARPFSGNRDIVEWLESKLHFYADYGPDTFEDTWGCALLSRWPILRSERVVLPSPQGEIACLIDATIAVGATASDGSGGQPIDIVTAHNGNTEHTIDRRLQTEESARRLKVKVDAGVPVAWAGYLDDKPRSPNYQTMVAAGVLDSNAAEMNRQCLYMFHSRRLEQLAFVRHPVANISDTEIQSSTYRFPPL